MAEITSMGNGVYNVPGYGAVGDGDGGGLGGLLTGRMRQSQYGPIDPNGDISREAGAAGRFAGQGEAGYGMMTREMGKDRDYLRGLQRGENSVSAEQLRQGLQQQYGMAQSMAASARPGQAPMAARTAMMSAGRAGSAMAGNQALAGIQERNAAASQLAALNQAQRGQDMNVALGSRQTSLQGYGGLEQARTQRYMADMGVPSTGESLLGAGAGVAGMAMMSDERLKKDVKDGSGGAAKLLKGLKAVSYNYKDPKHGKGEQLGIMAQDLERAGLKSAVIETREGKAVHGGKLAAALAAALPGLDRRLEKLEKGA